MFRELLKCRSKRLCVFIDEKTVSSVCNSFGCTAVPDNYRCCITCCGFSYNKTVCVKCRREEEEIGARIPGAELLSPGDRAGEEYLLFETELLRICSDLSLISASADENHAKINSLMIHLGKSIKNDPEAFVPHKSSYEEVARNIMRQIVT